MTSNPTLFAKAITETDLYDADIRRLSANRATPAAIFESLMVQDVRGAADVFRPVYESTRGDDGFVSIEIRPQLARDTEGSIVEARRLWSACGHPNVMVKIPATAEGIPAIRQCLAEGININITLLFSVPRYREVMEAYLSAMEQRVAAEQPVDLVLPGHSLPFGGHGKIIENLLGFYGKRQARLSAALGARPGQTAHELTEGLFQSSNRERADRVPGIRGGFRVVSFRQPAGKGSSPPAAALGFDVHEGPGLSGPLLRRGAGGAGFRRHHAARDAGGLSRSWRSEGSHP